jgi:ubiquinone/menaquinone biosynthesis C-methylase UbiE
MGIFMIVKILSLVFAVSVISTAWIWLPLLLITSPVWTFILVLWYSFIRIFGLSDLLQRVVMWTLNLIFLRFARMRRLTWKTFYNSLAVLVPSPAVKCMNCGFTALQGEKVIEVSEEYREERYSYQLYHYIATGLGTRANLEGLHVLEVGSGRGGGLQYVAKQLKPISAVGLDISKQQVAFSVKHCSSPNLLYAQGTAEQIPMKDSCVDVVICIESSHCFSSISSFIAETSRVLVKGGHLFFADLGCRDQFSLLESAIRTSQLVLVRRADITDNVTAALELDSSRRSRLIKKCCPICKVYAGIRPIIRHYAATADSTVFESLQTKDRVYVAYDLVKPSN